VALRPGTEYVLTGRARIDWIARLQVAVGPHELPEPLTSTEREAWQPLELRFTTGDGQYWLGRTTLSLTGQGAAWIDGLSLKRRWRSGTALGSCGESGRAGLLQSDRLPSCWTMWSSGRAARVVPAVVSDHARRLHAGPAERRQSGVPAGDRRREELLRYAVARWGCSTSVAVWEYFNEIDPNLPLDRFYRELGEYLEQIDIYGHLRSTSTWNQSARDCRHPQLDVADVHFYLRPVEPRPYADEVEAVLGNAAWLREHAPAKPALIGEFGLADPQWRPTKEMRESPEIVDFHHAIWASALSGVSGTALFWWWDRLDPRNHYPHYRPLADFVADIPWTTAKLRAITATVSDPQVRAGRLQGDDRAYFWLFDPAASWENVVIRKHQPETMTVSRSTWAACSRASYRVEWWDTRTGEVVQQERFRWSSPCCGSPCPVAARFRWVRLSRCPAGPSDRTEFRFRTLMFSRR
jgi:hypothetical protein